MNEEALQNIYNNLVSNKLTKSDYSTWKQNFSRSGEVQKNVHQYLSEKNLTKSNLSQWKTNLGVKKKEVSEPIAATKPLASSTPTQKPATSLATEEPEQAQASDGLGGPAKNPFGQEQKPVELGGFAVNQQPVQVDISKKPLKEQADYYTKEFRDAAHRHDVVAMDAASKKQFHVQEKIKEQDLKSVSNPNTAVSTEEEKPNMDGYWPVRKSDKDYYHPEEGFLKKAGKYTLGTLASAATSVNEWGENLLKSAAAELKFAGLDESQGPKLAELAIRGLNVSPIDLNIINPKNRPGWFGTVMNSSLSKEQKKSIITSLDSKAKQIQNYNDMLKMYQQEVQGDNIPTKILNGIVGFVPDLLVAAATENPAALEAKGAIWTEAATKKALPLIEKYAPRAAKISEKYLPKALKIVGEGVNSSMTKILAAKEGLKEMGETKEGENPYINLIKGSAKGGLEGLYMHGLGVGAGSVAKPLSKVISKSGLDSAIALSIATPLANAGVFTAARAIRTPIEEGRFATAEELATEAGTGIGFSLLHLGTQYNDQKKINNYYDSVLQNDALGSLGRVLNETKENLDVAHNPDLTPEGVKELEGARDELRDAILKEPDFKKKEILGNQALTIQNQLDAHNAINGIIENKDAVIDHINSNEHLTEEQKSFYTKKAEAIADTYDNSEYGLKKKELSAKVDEAQKQLDNAATKFSNVTKPSDRAVAQAEVDDKRKELEDLNAQLVDLVKNKPTKEAPAIEEKNGTFYATNEKGITKGFGTKEEAESHLNAEEKITNIDKARDKRWAENNDLAMVEGSTFHEDTSLKNAKVGDEFRFKEYKDGKWNTYNTKVKDIVDGKLIFENGKTQDDISSYMNKTAQDAWFDKNHPELSLQEKPTKEAPTVNEEFESKKLEIEKNREKAHKDLEKHPQAVSINGNYSIPKQIEISGKNNELRSTKDIDAEYDKQQEALKKEYEAPIVKEKPSGEKVVPLHEALEGVKDIKYKIKKIEFVNKNIDKIIKELGLETINCD